MPALNEIIDMEIYDSFRNERMIENLNDEIINQIMNEHEENRINIIDEILNGNRYREFNETEWLLLYDLLEDDIKNIFEIFINMGFEITKIFQVFVLIPRLSRITHQNKLIINPEILIEFLLSNQLPDINLTMQFWKQFKPELYEIIICSRTEKHKYEF